MNKKMYVSLAVNNIKKNKNVFLPFGLSAVTMIALFYMIYAIQDQTLKSEGFYGIASVNQVLSLGVGICGIFAAGVIFYTNSFLMKQRSKELGLYSILGMEKRHIANVLFWELALLGIGCTAAGLGFGILFSRLMFLLLLKMMKFGSVIPFGISGNIVLRTGVLFVLVFAAGMLRNALMLTRMKPIDLLKNESRGEREPKAKWLQAVLAVVCLGAGYAIAVTTENPIRAMAVFFFAVILVMAGTHLLFMSGSVAILKLLKKNKRYYFHKTHFITVSGMMYRMKRNAAGLSNICILSTAVLIVLSTTISLYTGVSDSVNRSYQRDVQTSFLCPTEQMRIAEAEKAGMEPEEALVEADVEQAVSEHAKKYGVDVSNVFEKFSLFLISEEAGRNVFTQISDPGGALDGAVMVNIVTQEEYNRYAGDKMQLEELPDGEVWIWDSADQIGDGETFTMYGSDFTAKYLPQEQMQGQDMTLYLDDDFGVIENSFRCVFMMVSNRQELERLTDDMHLFCGRDPDGGVAQMEYQYWFDIDGGGQQRGPFLNTLRDCLNRAGIPHVATVGNKFDDLEYFEKLYANLFFIGLFIGTMFLLATVLIIYYKQVSEGFEDRSRFEILQKVGMDKREVKKVITTQILQVFFLPLLLSCVHIAFAFFIVRRILAIMGFVNVGLFVGCTVVSILVFAAVYGIVYYLTAGAYYRIVYGER